MKYLAVILLDLCLLLSSCDISGKKIEKINTPEKKATKHTSNKIMTDDLLIEHVRLAINPKFQDWVLFKNGTYVIFDNTDTIADVKKEAIKHMKEFGPVSIGNPAGDFTVTHLTKTEGWSVSGHGYGMYTYVHPSELVPVKPTDLNVGVLGRSKRDRDSKILTIIHINRKTK